VWARTLRPHRCLPEAPHSIYAPRGVACQGVGQPSDLSSITGSAPGFSFLPIVITISWRSADEPSSDTGSQSSVKITAFVGPNSLALWMA
jgi:hypothetical protein